MAINGINLFGLQPVPAAGTYGSQIIDLKFNQQKLPLTMAAWCQLIYGSGGTSVDFYIQAALNGTDFFDVMNFHFTTSSDKKFASVNRQTAVVPVSTTLGSLTANTKNDGLFGLTWKASLVVAGAYVGSQLQCIIAGEN